MEKYTYMYNNAISSTHRHECDADAMMNAREELKTMHTITETINQVNVWRHTAPNRYSYVVSYKL